MRLDRSARFSTAAYAVLQVDGVLVQGQRGGLVKHPAFQVWRDSAEMVRTFGRAFGLTPASRANLPALPEDNSMDELRSILNERVQSS